SHLDGGPRPMTHLAGMRSAACPIFAPRGRLRRPSLPRVPDRPPVERALQVPSGPRGSTPRLADGSFVAGTGFRYPLLGSGGRFPCLGSPGLPFVGCDRRPTRARRSSDSTPTSHRSERPASTGRFGGYGDSPRSPLSEFALRY